MSSVVVLPARRYASAGLCDSDVSVCLSVCLLLLLHLFPCCIFKLVFSYSAIQPQEFTLVKNSNSFAFACDNVMACGRQFVLYGSIMAFYVPLIIMFATYALSVRILRRNHQLMKLIALGSVRRNGPKPSSDVAAAAATADTPGKTRHRTASPDKNPAERKPAFDRDP